METMKNISLACFITLVGLFSACAPASAPPMDTSQAQDEPAQMKALPARAEHTTPTSLPMSADEDDPLPVRFQKPVYQLLDKNSPDGFDKKDEEFVVLVGADISTKGGPVALSDILKRLANMKSMNISWASDVNQFSLVDVDIRAEDDFFDAINNLLRQLDYFYEVKGNTLVIKYKETKRFQIAMPFTASNYSGTVGGGSSGMAANLSLSSTNNTFDIWDNINKNLDKILEIWSQQAPSEASATPPPAPANGGGEAQDQEAELQAVLARKAAQQIDRIATGKGYYTIDKPIGLITVTAPQSLLEKVENYLETLKKEIYRQVTIEAKVLEVILADESRTGIDWTSLLSSADGVGSAFEFGATFGQIDTSNPFGNSRLLTLNTKSFSLLLNALKEQGTTKILANPKITVMNGQPALISVGENQTYIDKVTVTVEEGTVSTSVTTANVMSGIVMSVIATIIGNDEVILNLTPVTSALQSLEQATFQGGTQVGLPVISKREMNTLVRVKNGEMLVIGGLIDNRDVDSETKVPLFGDLPLINKLFKSKTKTKNKTELIILLQPRIML